MSDWRDKAACRDMDPDFYQTGVFSGKEQS
nr:MAG TPA: Transcriptional regulator [Bacteriophage sp.]